MTVTSKGLFGALVKATKESSIWPGRTSILWTIALIVEPLVFYAPLIDYQKKSLLYNNRPHYIIVPVLYIISCCVITLFYFSQVTKQKLPFGWINTFAITLLAPIYFGGLLLTLYLHTPKFLFTSVLPTLIALLLVLYLWRVLVIYRHFLHTALRKSAGFRIGINFVLFLYGGHLFGGLWYFFAVFQTMHCWSRACSSYGGCSYKGRRFIVSSEGSTFFDELCSNTSKNTFFDFGIFKDAIKSRIVETPYLGSKLLFCFRWGVQNISGFGQNLEVSMNPLDEVSMNGLDNIFVILMAIYGIVTFTFFIGNMQDLVISSTSKFNHERTERWSRRDLLNWYPFKQLSLENQNTIVKSCRRHNWPQSGEVNLQNLLSNLPRNIEINIKRIFCTDLLRKIRICETWSDEWINELCDCAKPVIYGPEDIIIENGNPIDEMLLVVEGTLEIKSYRLRRPSISRVKGDGRCGEELIAWFEDDADSEQLPLSSKTIKVDEQVHAFAIVPEDIQNAIKGHQASGPSQQK